MGKATVQHLILKPLSLYGDFDFEGAYRKIMEDVPLGGDGGVHVGDVAFGNLLGLNDCPGKRMIDIDPMGFARRCPENSVAYDATTLMKLEGYMKKVFLTVEMLVTVLLVNSKLERNYTEASANDV